MKHLILGIALLALGAWAMFTWWASFGIVMRALVPLLLLLFGVVAVLSSFNRFSQGDADDEFDGDLDDEDEPGMGY